MVNTEDVDVFAWTVSEQPFGNTFLLSSVMVSRAAACIQGTS